MVDQASYDQQNRVRIQAVENSFGPLGRPLLGPGRVLVGEGQLMKRCRRRPQPKVFFLFNDILVYGSIVLSGRWYKKQQVIPLEEVQLEDLDDGVGMANQWLLRTPRKSFHVAAASPEEKQAWMDHIRKCRDQQLQRLGMSEEDSREFAATWIPDQASAICMRCSEQFGITQRRHHCRRCGFIVCNRCSKGRAVLRNISVKPVRVCRLCITGLQGQEQQDQGKDKTWDSGSWKSDSEEDKSSDEENEEPTQSHFNTHWLKSSPYCYINPDHVKPPAAGVSAY
ncbi:pleckstrin homology domain-containing family F member 1 [Denticeps clupeoides]|uniref:Uncharacterized protein n=1 Tax=Denticeps clupeoides TaxID=299321 RepID=A0AAY4EPS2_9TELE|nr:pleckstrin homology domain-containing family F member 1 [Denticeps clupeoides]